MSEFKNLLSIAVIVGILIGCGFIGGFYLYSITSDASQPQAGGIVHVGEQNFPDGISVDEGITLDTTSGTSTASLLAPSGYGGELIVEGIDGNCYGMVCDGVDASNCGWATTTCP